MDDCYQDEIFLAIFMGSIAKNVFEITNSGLARTKNTGKNYS